MGPAPHAYIYIYRHRGQHSFCPCPLEEVVWHVVGFSGLPSNSPGSGISS